MVIVGLIGDNIYNAKIGKQYFIKQYFLKKKNIQIRGRAGGRPRARGLVFIKNIDFLDTTHFYI